MNYTIIGLDNDLSPVRFITNGGLLLMRLLGTNSSEIWIQYSRFVQEN